MNLSDCIAIYRTLGDNADKNLGLRNKMLDKLKDKYGEDEVPQKEVDKFNEELLKVLSEDQDVKLKDIKISDIPSKTELTAGFFVACQEIVTE